MDERMISGRRQILTEALRETAVSRPGQTAFTFLDAAGAASDLSYGDLDRQALAIAARPRGPGLPAVHLGPDRRSQGGHGQLRQPPPQRGDDPARLRTVGGFDHRGVAAALPRHGPDRQRAAAALPRRALHPADAGSL